MEDIDDVPEDEIKMLMLNDLESTTKGDYVVYMVGKYNSKDDHLKEYELDSQGFLDCYILVDNNGKIEKYTHQLSKARTRRNSSSFR